MSPLEKNLLQSTTEFLFKDVFGMRSKKRLHILQNSKATTSHRPSPVNGSIPGIFKPFLESYHAWKFAGVLKGVRFEILCLYFANSMYNEYKILCRDDAGTLSDLLLSNGLLPPNGLTPTIGRTRNDIVLECLAKGMGEQQYTFKQAVKSTESINALVNTFGPGIVVLLPGFTIDWYTSF